MLAPPRPPCPLPYLTLPPVVLRPRGRAAGQESQAAPRPARGSWKTEVRENDPRGSRNTAPCTPRALAEETSESGVKGNA